MGMGWDAETIRQAAETLAVGGAPVDGVDAVCGVAARFADGALDHGIIVVMPDAFAERVTQRPGDLLISLAEEIALTLHRFGDDGAVDLDVLAQAAEAHAIIEQAMGPYRDNLHRLAKAADRARTPLRVTPIGLEMRGGVMHARASSPADLTPPADTTIDPAGSVEQ